MRSDPQRFLYLPAGNQRLFAVYHRPAAAGGSVAALICAPWGWDEVASYRPRRAWAQRLAAGGHPTLRFDLPGTGNSTGSPSDEHLVASWILAVRTAATWLRENSGCRRVAALGLGIGGLLAMEAKAGGAPIDEVVLWATPMSGAAFIREARGMSRVQGWRTNGSMADLPSLPDGWIEASGFLLSADTIEEIEALSPKIGASSPTRALLLGRSGPHPGRELQEALEAGGAEVELAPGNGWAGMVSHPERSRFPAEVGERVENWLDSGPATVSSPTEPDGFPPPAETLDVEVGGARVVEAPVLIPMSFGDAFGILAEPLGGSDSDLCAVFLNAGAVRHTGPNRMWVERARAWAARGVPTLRVDLEALGESDGNVDGVPPGEEFFSPKYEQQVVSLLDALSRSLPCSRIALVGLCSGGYFTFRTVVRDRRIKLAVLINPPALILRPGLISSREAGKATRVLQPTMLKRLLRRGLSRDKLGMLLRAVGRNLKDLFSHPLRRLRNRRSWASELERELDILSATDTRLVLAFSGGELMAEELQDAGLLDLLGSRPGVDLRQLPGTDHTLRPPAAQAALAQLLDRELVPVRTSVE